MERDSLEILKGRLREFAGERDWDQFHSSKNLSMALIAEAAALIDLIGGAYKKLDVNKIKYPSDAVKGDARKHSEY